MRQQLRQRDGFRRRAKYGLPGGFLESFQHIEFAQLGEMLRDRLIQLHHSALDQLHGRNGCDGLGHRSNVENGIRRDIDSRCRIAFAEGAGIRGLCRGCNLCRDCRNLPSLDAGAQSVIDACSA